MACFDREVICRRAASAAFQECVGRLGNFPHGIAIVTAADFFSLATRANAYLTVAPTVAAFDPYHRPLATHLLHTKLAHWDPAVRDVAARALAALAPRDPAWYAIDAVDALVPRTLDAVLEARHGAALGLAALLPALDAAGATLGQERAGRVAGVVPAVEKARLYRGKGGELMRGAVCRLVGGMAAARIGEGRSCLSHAHGWHLGKSHATRHPPAPRRAAPRRAPAGNGFAGREPQAPQRQHPAGGG